MKREREDRGRVAGLCSASSPSHSHLLRPTPTLTPQSQAVASLSGIPAATTGRSPRAAFGLPVSAETRGRG